MSLLKAWRGMLDSLFSNDKRKAGRRPAPTLGAYYWTNSSPEEHEIRDISETGLYLVTEERWYPGTVVMVTLQRKDLPENSPGRTLAVHSKAVRWGEDGVGLEFVPFDSKNRNRTTSADARVADSKELTQFLKGFHSEQGTAVVQQTEMARKRPS